MTYLITAPDTDTKDLIVVHEGMKENPLLRLIAVEPANSDNAKHLLVEYKKIPK